MYFYQILQTIMDENNLNIPDVARASGLSDSTVRSIITRKSKSAYLDIAAKISMGLNIDIDVLNGNKINDYNDIKKIINGDRIKPNEKEHVRKYRLLDTLGKQAVDTVTDIVYKHTQQNKAVSLSPQPPTPNDVEFDTEMEEMKIYTIAAAAGLGNYLSGGESDYVIRSFPSSEIPTNADFGIRISGDSMTPTIEDGAIVWVKETIELCHGDVGIFILENDSLCKELRITQSSEGKEVFLVSHNSKYEPIKIREGEYIKTVGKVLL